MDSIVVKAAALSLLPNTLDVDAPIEAGAVTCPIYSVMTLGRVKGMGYILSPLWGVFTTRAPAEAKLAELIDEYPRAVILEHWIVTKMQDPEETEQFLELAADQSIAEIRKLS